MGFRLIHLPFFLSGRDLFSDKSRSMWRDSVGLGQDLLCSAKNIKLSFDFVVSYIVVILIEKDSNEKNYRSALILMLQANHAI